MIALAVASQESGFKNYANDGRGGDLTFGQAGIEASLRLPHEAVGTDHGSLGVFQQQWPWWGSMPDLMDPTRAAGKFYDALGKVPGWASLPVTVAAQKVQRSAYPDAYADDEALARALLHGSSTSTPVVSAKFADGVEPGCAGQSASGTVVFPISAGSEYVDQRNWGRSAAVWARGHTGTDFSVGCGTRVVAATGGRVIVRTDQAWSGRWLVQISTGAGQLTTWYAHMQRLTVRDGEVVTAGEQIGEVGDLGNSTGCHLHFEVHPRGGSIYQDSIDPSAWLATHVGKRLAGAAGEFVPGTTSPGSDSFTVATFNVLGASHTAPGGNKPWLASGTARTKGLVQLLAEHSVDVAGLQEFQRPQWNAFRAWAGGSFGMYSPPRTRADNTLIWRQSAFQLQRTASVAVPYFNGQRLRMPYVLLRQKSSGSYYWVVNVHNPADTARYPRQAKWRAQGTRIQVALISRLRTTGRPVILLGDMNERRRYFCAITANGTMRAAGGGGSGTPCRPPAYRGIDWIFGSTDLHFRAHSVDGSSQVDRVSDHPMVVAQVG